MRFQIEVDDNRYDALESLALDRGYQDVGSMVVANLDVLGQYDKSKNQVVLYAEDIATIQQVTGGHIIKQSKDIVNAVKNAFSIKVDDAWVILDATDAQALKDRYESTGYTSYAKYIEDSTNEAFSMYLWGSTRGILAY